MKKKVVKNRDLDFLYEVGCLRFIQRTWKHFYNPDFQNLAEHHLRVAWIALLLAKEEGIIDTGKILKMAIVHDLGESRTGDANYIQRQYVERNEKMGILDIFSDTKLEDEFVKVWEDYERKDSLEAKIVKDADNLDVDLELKEQEYKGNPLGKEWAKTRKFVYQNRLYTKSAKKLWLKIQKSDPHQWHRESRNRFNSGDWSNK